ALLAASQWRTMATATLTVAALLLVSGLVFGPGLWPAFLASTSYARTALLEGSHIDWYKFDTVFAAVRLWGGSVGASYALQGMTSVAVATAVAWLWRSGAPHAIKAAALALATILATPFAFDYDLMIVAPGLAFLAADQIARGPYPFERTALVLLWAMPLVSR